MQVFFLLFSREPNLTILTPSPGVSHLDSSLARSDSSSSRANLSTLQWAAATMSAKQANATSADKTTAAGQASTSNLEPSNSPIQQVAGTSDAAATNRSAKKRPAKTVVEYYGSSVGFCGYCKAQTGSRAFGRAPAGSGRHTFDMEAFALRPDDYQELLDRGWRRSGGYCYHPINASSCCPNYAISCKTTKFRLSRSQRLCIQNLNSFLVHGTSKQPLTELDYARATTTNHQSHLKQTTVHPRTYEQLQQSTKLRHKRFVKSCERKVNRADGSLSVDQVMLSSKERAMRGVFKQALLEDYLYPTRELATKPLPTPHKHKLQLKLFHVDSRLSQDIRTEENQLIQRYQEKVHKEKPQDWSEERFHDFLVDSPILVEPIRDRTYLAANGNMSGDDRDLLTRQICTKDYILVEPPHLPTCYGTYHCAYLLDGKLIAVGVLDVLPKCITTVYFFYDPHYEFLNLGIYSALVEISMVRELAKFHSKPSLQDPMIHYYLGFYVHECRKMRYKTQFYPSYLLCSETFEYVPTESCLEMLRDKKYSRFNLDKDNHFNVYDEAHEDVAYNLYFIPVMTPVTETESMAEYLDWVKDNFGLAYVEILFDRFLYEYTRMIGMPLLTRMRLKLHSIHRAMELRNNERKSDN